MISYCHCKFIESHCLIYPCWVWQQLTTLQTSRNHLKSKMKSNEDRSPQCRHWLWEFKNYHIYPGRGAQLLQTWNESKLGKGTASMACPHINASCLCQQSRSVWLMLPRPPRPRLFHSKVYVQHPNSPRQLPKHGPAFDEILQGLGGTKTCHDWWEIFNEPVRCCRSRFPFSATNPSWQTMPQIRHIDSWLLKVTEVLTVWKSHWISQEYDTGFWSAWLTCSHPSASACRSTCNMRLASCSLAKPAWQILTTWTSKLRRQTRNKLRMRRWHSRGPDIDLPSVGHWETHVSDQWTERKITQHVLPYHIILSGSIIW